MKIYDEDLEVKNKEKWLKITDFENFFEVYEDRLKKYFYNLNVTTFFDIDGVELPKYTLKHDLQWSLISYEIYGTTRLAWLLMKLNNIDASNVFQIVKSGTDINVLGNDAIQSIIADLNDFQTP